MRLNAKPILLIFATVVLWCCSSDRDTSISYLGQDPPALSAELFAPGLISTDSMEHSAPSFSPDGKIVLWTVLDRMYHASMMEMTFENGRWSSPHRANEGEGWMIPVHMGLPRC